MASQTEKDETAKSEEDRISSPPTQEDTLEDLKSIPKKDKALARPEFSVTTSGCDEDLLSAKESVSSEEIKTSKSQRKTKKRDTTATTKTNEELNQSAKSKKIKTKSKSIKKAIEDRSGRAQARLKEQLKEAEKKAAFIDKLQRSHAQYVQEPDGSLKKAACYHGYVQPSYVEEKLAEVGDYLLCKTYRDIDGVNKIELLCLAFRSSHDVAYSLIQIGKHKKFYFDKKGFRTIMELINHYVQTGENLPLNGQEKFILKRAIDRPSTIIKHNKVLLKEEIGHGEFGAVHKASYRLDGDNIQVAVKTLKELLAKDPNKKEKFLAEAYMMLKIRPNKNIVKIWGIATLRSPLWIILEFMPRGSLKSYLKKLKEPATDPEKYRYVIDAAAGLAHLEEEKIVHRDIAARNCLLAPDGTTKISDFGLSLDEKMLSEYKPSAVMVPIKWLAPEVILKQRFSHKSDVWAFGVMIFEVWADGGDPYPGIKNKEIKTRLTDGSGWRMPLPPTFPKSIQSVIKRCWAEDPAERASFKKLHKALEIGLNYKTDKAQKNLDASISVKRNQTMKTMKKKKKQKETRGPDLSGMSRRVKRHPSGSIAQTATTSMAGSLLRQDFR